MSDQSGLDQRYFVDEHVYNCPFCNRRSVAYSVVSTTSFDWTEDKRCYAYFVRCHSCSHESMHLAYSQIPVSAAHSSPKETLYRFRLPENGDEDNVLDGLFFYSVPTSFFVLDKRVPRVLRELLTECEGCIKSNFLTGASACARKIIYELAAIEKASGDNYEDRVKSLKASHEQVEPEFFDTLLTIQQVTSSKVHERSLDGWEAKHLRIIVASMKEILHEIYVVPALREDRRKSILDLKARLVGPKSGSTAGAEAPGP